jgi:hypothetical protein
MAPFFPAARSSLETALDNHVGVAVLAGAITVRPEDEVKELALVQVKPCRSSLHQSLLCSSCVCGLSVEPSDELLPFVLGEVIKGVAALLCKS